MNAAAQLLEQALEKLIEDGQLCRRALAQARERAERSGSSLEDELIGGGLLTEELLCCALAHALDTAYVFPDADSIDLELVARFPQELLWQLEVLPMVQIGDTVTLACVRPPGKKEMAILERLAGAPIQLVLATRRKLLRVLEKVCQRPARTEARIGAASERTALSSSSADPAAVTLLFGSLVRAYQAGASEIRFEPHPSGVRVRRREAERRYVDAGEAPIGVLGSLVTRAQILAGETEYGAQLCGERVVRMELGGHPVELRLTILRGDPRGPAIRVAFERPDSPQSCSPDHFRGAQLDARTTRRIAAQRDGLVLACGPYPAAARAFAAALAMAADPEHASVVTLGGPGATAPVDGAIHLPTETEAERRRAFDNLCAYAPDALVVLDLRGPGSAAGADRLLAIARHSLVVMASADPTPASCLLGWLEVGARPSLLAHALRAVVSIGPPPARALALWEPNENERRAIALNDRASLIAALEGGTGS